MFTKNFKSALNAGDFSRGPRPGDAGGEAEGDAAVEPPRDASPRETKSGDDQAPREDREPRGECVGEAARGGEGQGDSAGEPNGDEPPMVNRPSSAVSEIHGPVIRHHPSSLEHSSTLNSGSTA